MIKTKKTKITDNANHEAFLEFVRTLFADSRSMVLGAILQIAIMSVVIYDTQFFPLIILVFAVILSLIWRMRIASAFSKSDALNSEFSVNKLAKHARYWENRYILPSTVSAGIIGIFCLIGLRVASSEMAISALLCLLFAPVPTVIGRLYGSPRLVGCLLAALFTPVLIGYFSHGNLSHFILGMMCIPYIFLVLGMARHVRDTFGRAVSNNAEKVSLAKRFDIALSNMSHGLVMFDKDHKISVINGQALKIFAIPAKLNVVDRSVDVLLRYGTASKSMSTENAEKLRDAITRLLNRTADKQQVLLDDGRYLEWSISERSAGGLVMTFDDVTDRMLTSRKIERMANFDSLTGLATRQHFEHLMDAAVQDTAPNEYCALIVIDVDDFKYVNDAVGHAQGDALLRSVAARLTINHDLPLQVSRLGGDEFLMFVHGLTNEDTAEEIVAELTDRLGGIHDLDVEQLHVSCSVGYCVQETKTFSRDEAIVQADLALYAAKRSGKGVATRFDPSMGVQYQRRQKIKKKLGKAIETNSLSIIYQPLVDAKTGKMVSCEALSRWHDPDFGNVAPSEYIPLAEEMAIVTKISEQVLIEATSKCATWPEHVSVSVNLSPIDFRAGDIIAIIENALATSGLNPCRLEIEITETAVIANERDMIEKLHKIKAMGVKIALDDFGTGNSSLSYLHLLPLNKVKIDRSFVVGIDTGETPIELLTSVTELCRTLGLDVTVEGVEFESQLELVVNEARVDRIQGFIYGPGLPASGIDALSRIGKIPLLTAPIQSAVR